MTKSAYSALAKVYENLIADDDYKAWATYVSDKMKSLAKGKVGLDMACGSGYFTRALKRAGFDVTGVDLSPEMLTEAVKLTANERLNIRYTEGDMATYKGFSKVDFITLINDGVNYLPPKKLEKAFKNFYNNLNDGGVLFFDFSTEYKLRNVIGNNMFGEDAGDCAYLWFNELKEKSIEMQLTVFTREGDKFVKAEEEHEQFIYTLDEMVDLLKKSGYSTVIAQKHLGGEIDDVTQRIEITAYKKA